MLTIASSTSSIGPGETAQFQVADPSVAPGSVTWSLAPGPDGIDIGQIDATTGQFTAPQTIAETLEVTVVADAGEEQGTATVTLTAPTHADDTGGAFEVTPKSNEVSAGSTIPFKATRQSGEAVDVTWQLKGPDGTAPEALGSISDTGLYSAPAAFEPAVQSIEVIATDKQDAKRTASATVTPAATAAATAAAPPVAPPAATQEPTAPTAQADTITIEPPSVVLASRAVQRFEARDSAGKPVPAKWSLTGTGGLTAEVIGTLDPESGTYTSPVEITVERNVFVVASTASGANDKAFIVLTPGGVRLIPGEVVLRAGEAQQFSALVQGDPHDDVEWQISPQTGTLTGASTGPSIVYTAPASLKEDARVVVIGISKATKATNVVGYANVSLLADPWVGAGPFRLGAWLLVLAIVIPILYYTWPPSIDRTAVAAARTAYDQAQRVQDQRESAVEALTLTLTRLGQQQATPPADPVRIQELRTQIDSTQGALTAATQSLEDARRDTGAKLTALENAKDSQEQNTTDERRLFLLVVLAGALGSFVHTTRSFVDFIGNRRLRPSWAWWYILQPFTGAALAMVMYFVIRGGFFASATGATALNPWGFVAVAALVGLFSKQATNKLDELFSTMFKTDKERELRDKLQPGANSSAQPPRHP